MTPDKAGAVPAAPEPITAPHPTPLEEMETVKAALQKAVAGNLNHWEARSALAVAMMLVRDARAALAAAPKAAPSDDWRKLALQFDGQRMAAMAHLRTLLDNPEAHADAVRAFLAATPAEQVKEAPKAAPAGDAPAAEPGEWQLWAGLQETGGEWLVRTGPHRRLADEAKRGCEAGRDMWLIAPNGDKHVPALPSVAAAAPTVAPAEQVAPQLGMSNDELMQAWRQKLTTAEPKGQELSAFAVGIEWGWERARATERSDWNRVHHVLAKHKAHPGRTDEHLADVIDRALTPTAPTVAQPLTDEQIDAIEWDCPQPGETGAYLAQRRNARAVQAACAAAWGVKLGGGAV